MEMTAVLWVLYSVILPQFGILPTGKEIIFSKMFNRAPENEEAMAYQPLKSTEYEVSCGVEYDQSQIPDVSHLDMLDHDSITDKDGRSKRSTFDEKSKRKIIEVAIFVDSAFYSLYQKNTSGDPENAILQSVHNMMEKAQTLYSHHTLDIKFKLEIVKIEILKPNESAPNNYGGYAYSYLLDFCQWQSKLNKEDGTHGHWDHAALITGMTLFRYTDGKKHSISGKAHIGSICDNDNKRRCSISKGTHYDPGKVIAHEIAHSLGVLHDGEWNDCDGYFMGGRGMNWSPCSNRYIKNLFLSGDAWCLANDNTLAQGEGYGLRSSQHELPDFPVTLLTLDEQCKLSLGPSYSVFQDERSPFNDVCRELWCRSEVYSEEPKAAGKALDGSPCGQNMHCMEGSCRQVHSEQKS